MIKFITSNPTKFKEALKILAPIKIEHANIELDEIQEIDPHKIIRHKLKEAFKKHKGEFLVEDSSLYLDCLNGQLPGPLIKWFNNTIGTEGLYQLTKKMRNNKAMAKTLIGFAKNEKQILFFEGATSGKIVKPKGNYNFGYDKGFVPSDKNKTLGELKAEGKFDSSPRGIAFKKLKQYLLKHRRQ